MFFGEREVVQERKIGQGYAQAAGAAPVWGNIVHIKGAGDAPPTQSRQIDTKVHLATIARVNLAVGADGRPGLQGLPVKLWFLGVQCDGIQSEGLAPLVEGAKFLSVPGHAGVGWVGQGFKQVTD